MSFLSRALLPERSNSRLGAVIHIGAGGGLVLADYLALQPQFLLLVEGDPDTAAELRDLAAPLSWAHVLEATVAPVAGPARWYRYNLPALNGLCGEEHLRVEYPRVRLLSQLEVRAETIDSIVTHIPANYRDTRTYSVSFRNVIVIDIASSGEELAAALSCETLNEFDTVIVRTQSRTTTETYADGGPAKWMANLQMAAFDAQLYADGHEAPGDIWIARKSRTSETSDSTNQEDDPELTTQSEPTANQEITGRATVQDIELRLEAYECVAPEKQQISRFSEPPEATDRIRELEQALAQVANDHAQAYADLQAQLELAKAKLREYQDMAKRLMQDLHIEHKRVSDLEKRVDAAKVERDEARQQLSLALKTQALREQSGIELHRALVEYLTAKAPRNSEPLLLEPMSQPSVRDATSIPSDYIKETKNSIPRKHTASSTATKLKRSRSNRA